MTKTNEQFESLLETLLSVRDSLHQDIPALPSSRDRLRPRGGTRQHEDPSTSSASDREQNGRGRCFGLIESNSRDFGPFKGRQAINLPEAPGVAVVYGENMRGQDRPAQRDSLRALRQGARSSPPRGLAPYHRQLGAGRRGPVRIRGGPAVSGRRKPVQTHAILSTTRSGVVPEQHSDYDVKHFLQRDGEVLGPGQATAEIERIMPEKIARFFLFDGELLQEYEDLLAQRERHGTPDQRSDRTNPRSSSAHGRSRATLAKLLDDYGKKEAKSAQANTITSELGTQMNVLLDETPGPSGRT